MNPLTFPRLLSRSALRNAHLLRLSSTFAKPPPFPQPSTPSHRNPSTSWTPTPFITETTGGHLFTYDVFSRLLKERIIHLQGAVDDSSSAGIVAMLLYLEADAPEKPISLYINSPGGSVTAGLAIYDTMQYIASPVSTICLGQAASMGSLLLAGGDAGRRYCLPHSSLMIHQPSGGYFGQASDIAIHAKEILRVREQLNKIYQRHMTPKGKDGEKVGTKSLEDIEKLMERDRFMSAEEGLELGIVDEILDRRVKSEDGEGKKNT